MKPDSSCQSLVLPSFGTLKSFGLSGGLHDVLMVVLNLIIEKPWARWGVLFLFGILPFFLQLGSRGLNEPDEGRYSEMSREMSVTGDWILPRLNGVPHYAKPPLTYWSVATAIRFFGYDEWVVRLPSALAAAWTVLMVYGLGSRMQGVVTGLFAAGILSSFTLFFVVGRLITPDMILTASITTSLYCFWRWWSSPRETRIWLWIMYGVMGLGFLNKGPFALLVVILTVVPFVILQGQSRALWKMGWIRGCIILSALILPWFLYMCWKNPDLWSFYIDGEIKGRLSENGGGRAKPVYFHLLFLPLDLWPWTVFFVAAVGAHYRRWKERMDYAPVSCFLLCWVVLSFIMFSLIPSKLPTYVLPVLPGAALMTGFYFSRNLNLPDRYFPEWVTWGTCLLLPWPLLGGIWYIDYRTAPKDERIKMVWILMMIALGVGIVLSLIFLWIQKRLTQKILLGFTLLTALSAFQSLAFCANRFETQLGHNSSVRSLLVPLLKEDLVGVPISSSWHPAQAQPRFERPGPRVVMYEHYARSISFYLMRDKAEVVPVYGGASLWEMGDDQERELKPTRDDLIELLQGDEQVYVITRKQNWMELKSLYPGKLSIIKHMGRGDKELVLLSNR